MASKKNNPPPAANLIFSRSTSTSSATTTSAAAARRHFHWSSTTNKVTTSEEEDNPSVELDELQTLKNHIYNKSSSTSNSSSAPKQQQQQQTRRKLPVAVSRIRSVVMTAITTTYAQYKPSSQNPRSNHQQLGTKVIGTLFGHRKGHVNFVFQREHNTSPVFFVELATSITNLVKEMASGLVRIALECDITTTTTTKSLPRQEVEQQQENSTTTAPRRLIRRRKTIGNRRDSSSTTRRMQLVEEPNWRAYCNGKKCGFAVKREPGPRELKILKVVEPISMGAGVLPGFNGEGLSGPDGDLMYMRAKFERVVGSRDSEAFYMMNPDSNSAPELSLYLLRV